MYFSIAFNLYIIGEKTVDLGTFNVSPIITEDINIVNIAPSYFHDIVLKNGKTLQLRTLKNIESDIVFSGSFLVK